MKNFKLYILKYYLKLGLFFYFKKIKVHGLENLSKDKPVLLLSNHQNALLDALLIATTIKGFAHYLTRASVFTKAFVSKLLQSFQLIPVYRIRDGYSNLTSNNAIFDTAANLLDNNKAVAIFPEGSHNLARRVRPLSKGFTRIIFNVLDKDPDSDLQLVPIGLNFKNATNCPDSAAIYFGKPLEAKAYVSDTKNESIVKIKKEVHDAISQLTTHIPVAGYNKTISKLEEIQVDFLNPEAVNRCIASNFEACKTKTKLPFHWLHSGFKYLLILNLLVPYAIWKLIAQPKIKEVEFTATFRFAIAVTLVPIYLILIGIVLTSFLSFKLAFLYIVSVLVLTLLAVKL